MGQIIGNIEEKENGVGIGIEIKECSINHIEGFMVSLIEDVAKEVNMTPHEFYMNLGLSLTSYLNKKNEKGE